MAARNVINNHKADFKKVVNMLGVDTEKLYTPASLIGLTWAPELLFKQEVSSMTSVVGSGVYALTFLASAQVFGLKGVITHSMIYGAGSTAGAFIVLLQ